MRSGACALLNTWVSREGRKARRLDGCSGFRVCAVRPHTRHARTAHCRTPAVIRDGMDRGTVCRRRSPSVASQNRLLQRRTRSRELAIEAFGPRRRVLERSGTSRVLDRRAQRRHSERSHFERAAAQAVRDLSHRFGAVGGDRRAQRRQMDRDIGEKQAGDFRVDVRLARSRRAIGSPPSRTCRARTTLVREQEP